MQGRRGRLGTRSKYVDVMNPGETAGGGGGSGGPPPPPGPPLMSSMPGIMGQPFPGSFFVPQQPGTYMYMCVGGRSVCTRKRRRREEVEGP